MTFWTASAALSGRKQICCIAWLWPSRKRKQSGRNFPGKGSVCYFCCKTNKQEKIESWRKIVYLSPPFVKRHLLFRSLTELFGCDVPMFWRDILRVRCFYCHYGNCLSLRGYPSRQMKLWPYCFRPDICADRRNP